MKSRIKAANLTFLDRLHPKIMSKFREFREIKKI